MKRLFFAFVIVFFTFESFSQSAVRFEQNKGQWEEQVLYMARLEGGFVFVREDGLLFSYSPKTSHNHDISSQEDKHSGHAFLLRPYGMQNTKPCATDSLQGYSNYFIGNDPAKWQSNVSAFSTILYKEVYSGIDWKIYSENGKIKHEFIVAPGADVSQIQVEYRGVESMKIIDGNLHLQLSIGTVVEQKPVSFQQNGDLIRQIGVSFQQNGDLLSYDIETFNHDQELIIDPELIFSTYSGSVSDNWGFTATYDDYGNLYSGSIVSGVYYPTTEGAFSDNFGGVWDCAITKYSADGSQMIFSTYLGGSYSEMPHSMIVDSRGDLIVFGTTGSFNFPTTEGAYSRWFSGGTAVTYDGTVTFPHGVDMYISRFSSDGTQLNASTYIGGSSNDGLNYRDRYNSSQLLTYIGNDSLYANYGDGARGELITDDRNNIYVGSSTFSTDFPTTAGAFQPLSHGEQEGVVLKLDYTLGTLLFSSYIGGSSDDAVFSIDTDDQYRLYVTGGTVSTDFPTSPNAYNATHNGGSTDAFVALVSYDGSTLLGSTYFGSSEFDLSYFVRTDCHNNPHIFGQTKAESTTLVHNAQYNIPNSGQFIAKFKPLLDSLEFSTVFGTGDGRINISPTGFAVDVCGRIYASGWGRMFKYLPNLPPQFGTMNMQTTSDCYQSNTDGQDFYIISLQNDASALDYATFFGEVSTTSTRGADHVDGGTSRFDKKGNLYQVACASCGGTDNFPIYPANVWSSDNGSTNCNAASFKFNIHSDFAVADFSMPDFVCYPDSVRLDNRGRADRYLWLFGDGTSSTETNPTHHYAQSGTYTITQIAYMDNACRSSDTLSRTIILLDNHTDTLSEVIACGGELVQIGLTDYPSSDVSFQWYPENGLSSPNVPDPYLLVSLPTDYRLVITTSSCNDTLLQPIRLRDMSIDLPDTIHYCNQPYSLQLPSDIPSSYSVSASWQSSPEDVIAAVGGVITIEQSLSSWLYINITEGNCSGRDSVYMDYGGGWLNVQTVPVRCNSESNGYAIATTGGLTQPIFYSWSCNQSGEGIDSVGNLSAGSYTLSVTDANGCSISEQFVIGSTDDISVVPTHSDNPCQNVCNAAITLAISGGSQPYSVQWDNNMTGEHIEGLCSGIYVYTLTDDTGCSLTDSIEIKDIDTLRLELSASRNNCPEGCGAVISSEVYGGQNPYTYSWSEGSSSANLTNVCCGEYSLSVSDANGCTTAGSITVDYIDAFADFQIEASQSRVFDGQSVILSCTPIEQMHYLWTPSEHLSTPYMPSTEATMYSTTTFYVFVSDNHGCSLKDSVVVEVDVVNCGKPNLYVPNIFTPNDDGKNDKVFVSGDWIEDFTFEIFDRWGEKVFSTSDLNEGWDGTFNGRKCDAAVYFYKLEVRCQGGKTYIGGGDITLIR